MSLEKAASDLLELKKIKNRIKQGYAQPGEVDYYEGSKEAAWKALEQALDYGDAKGYRLPSALDIQHGGQHYKGRSIQPVEYAAVNNLSFNLGSVLKYITRYREKDGLVALKKALHFLQFEIEQVFRVRTKVEYDDGNIGGETLHVKIAPEKVGGVPWRATPGNGGGGGCDAIGRGYSYDEHSDIRYSGGADAPRR